MTTRNNRTARQPESAPVAAGVYDAARYSRHRIYPHMICPPSLNGGEIAVVDFLREGKAEQGELVMVEASPIRMVETVPTSPPPPREPEFIVYRRCFTLHG